MTTPLQKPRRKSPVERTRQLPLLPEGRSRTAQGLTAAAANGQFALQVCDHCKQVQYPPREVCGNCLSPDLPWQPVDDGGTLIATTEVAISSEIYFRERALWRTGIVAMDCGPSILAHLHGDCQSEGRVRLTLKLDRLGRGVMVALPIEETANMADDPMLREHSCDPKFRRMLITDGASPIGQALAVQAVQAGAELVFVGIANPWKPFPGQEALARMERVALVPLDVTDTRSVEDLAAQIGGRVDILVNTAEYIRPGVSSHGREMQRIRESMEINYFGLARLAQSFGPAMRSRAADRANSACAWVNILSVYALANLAPFGTFSESKAAAYSLSHALRGEMQANGVRVINMFPGPVDDEWHQTVPAPKVAPSAVATAIITALKDGVEDVYVGDIARDIFARWRDNPKALEREDANLIAGFSNHRSAAGDGAVRAVPVGGDIAV
jgi:NAD(P)-dependent dehydrogenase (short-subunit alcohol dehydrogenase family)/uncharacterized OB-fold protein